jgi:thiamine biosynthesis lipoprotein
MEMKKSLLGLIALAALLIAARLLPLENRGNSTLRVQRSLMGTIWNIELVPGRKVEQAQKAIDSTYKELERIEALMSEWQPKSAVSMINQYAGKKAVEVPVELRELIERSVRYSELSRGVFDITWRGMGHIWHFDDRFRVPAQSEIEKARVMVDYSKMQIEGDRIFLGKGMSIGLGGIAKGYAIDRAAGVLRKAGFESFLIDGGGDVFVSGGKAGKPWRLGIQDPRQERGTLIGTVPLSNGVLITSGDYERFRMVDGIRYHHIIDPRTGWPAKSCQSVTILSTTAEKAVVLAKVLFILGPEEGLQIAQREGVEALIIDAAGTKYWTKGLQQQFEAPPQAATVN